MPSVKSIAKPTSSATPSRSWLAVPAELQALATEFLAMRALAA